MVSWLGRALCACSLASYSADAVLLNPSNPMRGWNTGYCCPEASAEDVLAQVEVFKAHGLLEAPLSYDHIMLDRGWAWNASGGITLDANGRILPNPAQFPQGLAALSAQLKAMPGSPKLGVWLAGGIPQEAVNRSLPVLGTHATAADIVLKPLSGCPWGAGNPIWYLDASNPSTAAYLDSQVELLAEWGVEFVKLDCVFGDQYPLPGAKDAIAAYSAALQRSSHTFELILSPGGEYLHYGGEQTSNSSMLEFAASVSNTARLLNDMRDVVGTPGDYQSFPTSLWQHFNALVKLGEWCVNTSRAAKTFFCHQDILPFGYLPAMKTGNASSSFGPGEQEVVLTIWGATRSPLIMGAMMTKTADDVIAKIGNKLFIEFVDGIHAIREIGYTEYSKTFAFANTASWSGSSQWWVAMICLGPWSPVSFSTSQLNITENLHAVEVWSGKDFGILTPSQVVHMNTTWTGVWLMSLTPGNGPAPSPPPGPPTPPPPTPTPTPGQCKPCGTAAVCCSPVAHPPQFCPSGRQCCDCHATSCACD